jgi:cytoskeletal protein RodZ
VSTILKSLKKLEQENQGFRGSGPHYVYGSPGSFKLEDAKDRWIKNPWFKRALLIVAIVGLGASGIYFFNRFQTPLDSRKSSQPEAASGKTETGQSLETARRAELPTVSNTARQGSTSVEGYSRAEVAEQDHNPSREGVGQWPAQPQSLPRDEIHEPAPRRPAAARSTAPEQAIPKSKQQKSQKSSSDSFENVPVLTDGKLKVHAIVWSSVQEDRMAVVNSQIIHEGDSVDGHTVVAIRPDDVVVRRDGGGRFRVVFGRP